MTGLTLLVITTFLYAGYNILIKASTQHVPHDAPSTITATICLQIAALAVSFVFLAVQKAQIHASLLLPAQAYIWAAAAGLCIGAAEITYFYLFAGIGSSKPMQASVAIPVIVSGAIVIALIVGWLVLKEGIAWPQFLGAGLIASGIFMLFIKSEIA